MLLAAADAKMGKANRHQPAQQQGSAVNRSGVDSRRTQSSRLSVGKRASVKALFHLFSSSSPEQDAGVARKVDTGGGNGLPVRTRSEVL